MRPAIHPGEILRDELAEIGVTPTELSRQINVPPNRVTKTFMAAAASPATPRSGLGAGSAQAALLAQPAERL